MQGDFAPFGLFIVDNYAHPLKRMNEQVIASTVVGSTLTRQIFPLS
jgi:hypothetical protein